MLNKISQNITLEVSYIKMRQSSTMFLKSFKTKVIKSL